MVEWLYPSVCIQAALNQQLKRSRRAKAAQITPGVSTYADVVLPYAHRFTQGSSATPYTFGASSTTFNLNSVYNPATSTHQPYGFDQYAALYNYYKVHGVRVKITAVGPSTTCLLCWKLKSPNDSSTLASQTVSTVYERPGNTSVWIQQGAGKPFETEFDVDLAMLSGLTRAQFEADSANYSAAVTASPTRVFPIEFNVTSPGSSQSVDVIVELKYRVRFWDRQIVAQS